MYQLVAVGHLEVSDQRLMVYSDVVYKTNEEAEAAIPAYGRKVLLPKPNNKLMELKRHPLRVFVKPLKVK